MNSYESEFLRKVRIYGGNNVSVVKQIAEDTYVCEKRDASPHYDENVGNTALDWLRSFERAMKDSPFENVHGEVSYGQTPSGGAWVIAQITFNYKKKS